MRKEVETAGKLFLSAAVLGFISRSAFNSEERKIIETNSSSLCALCGRDLSPKIIRLHHIIPECLENGNSETHRAVDKYVKPILSYYQDFLKLIPEDKISPFRSTIKEIIHSAQNGLVLCEKCHTNLHQADTNNEDLFVKYSLRNDIPISLAVSEVKIYFQEKIIQPILDQYSIALSDPTRI